MSFVSSCTPFLRMQVPARLWDAQGIFYDSLDRAKPLCQQGGRANNASEAGET